MMNMEIKTCFNDALVKINHEILIIERKNGFLSINSEGLGGGIKTVKSIVAYNQTESLNQFQKDEYLNHKIKEYDILEPSTNMGSFDLKKIINLTDEKITVIITADKNLHLNFIVLLKDSINESALPALFKYVIDAKNLAYQNLGLINTFLNDNNLNDSISVSNDSIIVACPIGNNIEYTTDSNESLSLITEHVTEAVTKLLKNMGYPRDIFGYIEDVGVTITELADAGMELCAGVEKTEVLTEKIRKQLCKSLEDLNVVSLIMAGIRLEEDLAKHRIQGIDVDDDPAYLYSDEVLGMAVANQIAGTKAIFNFKRYDEEKPGVIGKLGPVLDDVFAGLVAGCMSKIFEE
jgi:alpha-ribazole phosphatase CobZ